MDGSISLILLSGLGVRFFSFPSCISPHRALYAFPASSSSLILVGWRLAIIEDFVFGRELLAEANLTMSTRLGLGSLFPCLISTNTWLILKHHRSLDVL